MIEIEKLKAYMDTLAKEIVETTSEKKENGFYKTSETNLLSLL